MRSAADVVAGIAAFARGEAHVLPCDAVPA
jgi:hypothetical protein